jgi:hypothetical protein
MSKLSDLLYRRHRKKSFCVALLLFVGGYVAWIHADAGGVLPVWDILLSGPLFRDVVV